MQKNLSLIHLCSIPSDSLCKLPALVFQLFIFHQLDAILCDNRNAIYIQTSCISIEQHLHASPYCLNCVFLCQVLDGLLVRNFETHDRLCQMSTISCCQTWCRKCC